MICDRYIPVVAGLLCLALVPTVIHSYVGLERRDERSARLSVPALDGSPVRVTDRKAPWVRRVFKTDDWSEQRYRLDGRDLTLFVARSYDAKALYHHPELALVRGVDLGSQGTLAFPALPGVPVHALAERKERGTSVLYVLEYDGSYVDNPILLQVRTAAEQLLAGRKPLTLILVTDPRPAAGVRLAESSAARLLAEAVRSYDSQKAVTTRW